MASRKSRGATRLRDQAASARARRPQRQLQPKGRRRRHVPWYRKPRTWWWAAAGATAAGLVAFALFGSSGNEGGGSGEAPFVGGDLHSLVADPAADRLYVGGHEGVAVSTNGGTSWRQVESLSGADAMGWAFAGDQVLVGGHPGLFVSEDGGRTFEMRNEGLPATDVHALGAGEGVIYGASPAAGVFTSTDGGKTWDLRTAEVGQSFMGRILVDPDDPDHLIAPDMQAGAAESTDGGRTWRALGGVGAMWVTWDPRNTDHLIVSGMGQAAESTDGGGSWRPITVPQGASVIEMDPTDPAVLYAGALEGTDAVISVSMDGGASWTTL